MSAALPPLLGLSFLVSLAAGGSAAQSASKPIASDETEITLASSQTELRQALDELSLRTDWRDGSWIVERTKFVAPYGPEPDPVAVAHFKALALRWDHLDVNDREWLRVNGFDNPKNAIGHPLLQPRRAWTERYSEYVTARDQALVHIIIGSGSNAELRTQYTHDGLSVEWTERNGVRSHTTVRGRNTQSLVVGPTILGRPFLPKEKSALEAGASLARRNFFHVIQSIADCLEKRESLVEAKRTANELVVDLKLLSPHSREDFRDGLLPYGFDLIPGSVSVRLSKHVNSEELDSVNVVWLDALGATYAADTMTLGANPGEFQICSRVCRLDEDHPAMENKVVVVVDRTQAAVARPVRWIPMPGETVDDHRGTEPVAYKVGELAVLPTLLELEQSRIYQPPKNTSIKTPKAPQPILVDCPVTLSGESAAEIDLGVLPIGDTPIRVALRCDDGYVGIVNLDTDCGCVQVSTDAIVIESERGSFLNATVAVRQAGKESKTIGVHFTKVGGEAVLRKPVILSYEGRGQQIAVLPEQIFLGAVVSGQRVVQRLHVLLPNGVPEEQPTVDLNGRKCTVRSQGTLKGGWMDLEVECAIPQDGLGAQDFYLRVMVGEFSALATLSCSIAPSNKWLDVWPSWRIPLSLTRRVTIRFDGMDQLHLSALDNVAEVRILPFTERDGLVFEVDPATRTDPGIRHEVLSLELHSALGPIRLLYR